MERWTVRNVKFNTEAFAQKVGISPVVAKLLVNRGIYDVEEAKRFLASSTKLRYSLSSALEGYA